MSTALIIRFVLVALVFIAWAWLLYRAMSDASSRSGGIREWLSAPEVKKDRSTLFFLTFVLVAMVAMQVLLPAA